MASSRINVLVYSGNGSTVESVRHCLYTLRRLLAPNYAVIPVTGDMLIKEPWTATCAALVFPGGADQGYCQTLNGEGNRRIKRFVEQGGIYIGFCAGGYYGCKRCEFEVGNKLLEVIGDRELAFYPGTCRGCAFPGFAYHSEKGARAAELKVDKAILTAGSVPNIFNSYYNGGGVFVDAPKYRDRGVEVLASYTEDIAVDAGEGAAAIVYCKVGEGAALLTGPHPEYAAVNLEKKADVPGFSDVVDVLANDEKYRMDFLKACLTKLGLQVSDQQNVPSLSRIHLSSAAPATLSDLVTSLSEIISIKDGEEYLMDENDTFHIVKPSTWTMLDLKESLPGEGKQPADQSSSASTSPNTSDRIIDYNTITKQVLIHDSDHPAPKETPYFNHAAYYSHLSSYQSQPSTTSASASASIFGSPLLYGEVVTSTNTLLEKNTALVRRLPTGLTFTATVQVAGRGRGSNIWISPAGSLMFSTVIRHPMSMMRTAPVVFVQYLAAMAVVIGVKSYDSAAGGKNKPYTDLPLKLKWPNDIYALLPSYATSSTKSSSPPPRDAYTKIGGILVNSHYSSTEYIMVVGVGLNTSNTAPSTSLNALLAATSPLAAPFTIERLLPRILTTFQDLYTRFMRTGFDEWFLAEYYKEWLHMGQEVTLESEGGRRARIRGITGDYGLLVADEVVDGGGRGKTWELMADGNGFDFFRGLVKRKET